MSLSNLQAASSEDFTPFVKYNAKSGRWSYRWRPNQQTEATEIEIPNPRFVADMEAGQSGWIWFPQSGKPVVMWDGAAEAAKPADGNNYKRGFRIMIFVFNKTPDGQPIGWREWMSNSMMAVNAVVAMNAQFIAGVRENPGKLPGFICNGVNPVQSAHGPNYEPNIKLEGWVEKSRLPAIPTNDIAASGNIAPPQSHVPPAVPPLPPGPGAQAVQDAMQGPAPAQPQYDDRNPPPNDDPFEL